MSREAPPLGDFERGYRRTIEPFNRHDFETASRACPRISNGAPSPTRRAPASPAGPRRSSPGSAPDEFPDWRVEPQEFIDADPAILVRNAATATGGQSGAPIRQEFTQVWTFRDGRAVRVDEYAEHAEALRAVGLAT